jgi:hypothetical protein
MPSARDWEGIDVQRRRLYEEDERAEAQVLEIMARKARIRKQMKALEEKEMKLMEAGCNSLDELEELEKKEQKEAEEKREREEREAAVEELLAQPTPPGFSFDPGLAGPSFDPSWVCSDSQLAELGFDGGTS